MKKGFYSISIAAGRLGGLWGAGAYLGAALFVACASLLEKEIAPEAAVDRALTGPVFGWTIPLLAYAAVARVANYRRLDDAVRDLARHGADRRATVAWFVLMTAARVAVVGALVSALAVLLGSSDPPALVRTDMLTSAWIGAVGGAAYTGWFSLGSLWGKTGGGRLFALAVDWVLGGAASAVAVPWPRAHLRSLLGGDLVAGLPAWQSSVTLGLLAVLYFFACVLRVAR